VLHFITVIPWPTRVSTRAGRRTLKVRLIPKDLRALHLEFFTAWLRSAKLSSN